MNPFKSGSYMHCGKQCIEACSTDQSAQSAEKFFTLIFLLSGLALVAPLRFHSDVLELPIATRYVQTSICELRTLILTSQKLVRPWE